MKSGVSGGNEKHDGLKKAADSMRDKKKVSQMLDIVFGDSACGSLKYAQHFGQGKYHDTCTVLLGNEEASEEETTQTRRRIEEESRREWENAQPMGGDPGDVYGFGLGLSVGDISEDTPGSARRGVLRRLFHFGLPLPEIMKDIDRILEQAVKDLKEILDRSANGEPVRLWYSDQPDEMCGFYWITARLNSLKDRCGPISMVKLPPCEQQDDGTVVTRNGWGEVSPGEWHKFLPLEQPMSLAFRRSVTAHWRSLQEENAPLRAVLNGRLVSVPEDLYDSFIRRELAKVPDEFHEAQVIGNVLGRFQLGISDGLVANRIDAMIKNGELEVAAPAADGAPSYWRVLRKRRLQNS